MFAVCGVPSELAPVNRLVVPLFGVPEERFSAADKRCRVYPSHPRPDAVAYSKCILETETRSLTTPNKFTALSTEVQPLVPLPESAPTTSNSEHSNAPEVPNCVKRKSRNRRKRPKVPKPEIEIKRAQHRPRKSTPTEYATDEEDIMYDVEEEALEPKPKDKFVMGEILAKQY
ncbi:hypothetical protein TNCV_5087591 [Trichonephila clavipes]|nr:hypothetical protein TNCV_5087591 [Trichonephila clavipes]